MTNEQARHVEGISIDSFLFVSTPIAKSALQTSDHAIVIVTSH